jgi:uncharacterized protein YpbB
MPQTLEPAEIVKNFINQTKQSIFLTGKAGTGKTTLLKEIIETTHKQTVVVAPTGIAALNAGGVTIHSMFQLPFASFIPDFGDFQTVSERFKIETKDSLMRHFHMNKNRISIIKNLELLVIDEVSMLRADLLDAIDWVLRNIRKKNEAFGGVQVLFIGDLLQLPPIVKNEEWSVLCKYYSGIFFFNSHVLTQNPPVYVELEKIYRQDDIHFIQILNNLRNNKITSEDTAILNKQLKPNFDSRENFGYITLTTHNYKADQINKQELEHIKTKSQSYAAEIVGDFPQHLFPLEPNLELKVGAQVMFIKNDISAEKLFFNGKMGVVKALSQKEIFIEFPEEKTTIEVEKYEWENIRYTVDPNTKEIKEETIGTFVHYPLKLAWAITVHKSQGLTFDKAILDVSDAFAPGQAYVALSRLRSLKGLVLLKPFVITYMRSDQNVIDYAQNKYTEEKLLSSLSIETKKYLLEELIATFDFNKLISAWRIHAASYLAAGVKSEKFKHLDWATHQAKKLENLGEPSKKFQQQIERIFAHPEFNVSFLKERIDAAYDYFFKLIDEVLVSTLKKMEEIKRKPKIKAFFDELIELDEFQTDAILALKKMRLLLEAIDSGKVIQKNIIWTDEMKMYKITKLAIIRQDARQNKSLLDIDMEDEEDEIIIPVKKEKKQKETKIPSVDITLQLFEYGKSINEIAKERVLSESTIYSHAGQLLRDEKIEIHQLISETKIKELEEAFKDFNGESVTPLKEKYGDKFSWDELRLFRMSLLK